MTDDERLNVTLAKLAQPAGSQSEGARELRATPTGGLIGAILGEIDETVLARKLTLQNQNGDVVVLEVANRRLICLAGLSGNIATAPHDGSVGEVLSEARVDLVNQLHVTLAEFSRDDQNLSVTATASTGDFGPAEPGITTLVLARIWADAEELTTPSAGLIENFANACQEFATAEIRIRAGVVELKRGEADDIEFLDAFAATDQSDVQKSLTKCLTANPTDARLIVSSGPVELSAVISASQGEQGVHLLVPSIKRLEIIAVWQGLKSSDREPPLPDSSE